jgi:hypothetical protein
MGLISEEKRDMMLQNNDILEYRIESIELDVSSTGLEVQKLKFFHFWFYYFVNNAVFRFNRKLFKTPSFSFTEPLFG